MRRKVEDFWELFAKYSADSLGLLLSRESYLPKLYVLEYLQKAKREIENYA